MRNVRESIFIIQTQNIYDLFIRQMPDKFYYLLFVPHTVCFLPFLVSQAKDKDKGS